MSDQSCKLKEQTKNSTSHDPTLNDQAINLLLQNGIAHSLPQIVQRLLNAALTPPCSLNAPPISRPSRTNAATPAPTAPCKAAVATMYLQGVSTRRVTKIVGDLCGMKITPPRYPASPPSASSALPLNGKRIALGVSAALSEAEPHWRDFITSLRERGLGLPDSVTSDAHEGLKAALRATLPSIPWQRCQFHLQQNAQAYVPRQELKTQVANDLRHIFDAPDRPHAEAKLAQTIEKYRQIAPKLSTWMEANLAEGLTVFSLPETHRKRLRNSNMCETLNRQIKRRTRVAGLLPASPDAALWAA